MARRRHAVMAELREIHQLQLEGKWDATDWIGFGKGELHNGVAEGEVHEEIAALIMDQTDKKKIKSRPMGLGA